MLSGLGGGKKSGKAGGGGGGKGKRGGDMDDMESMFLAMAMGGMEQMGGQSFPGIYKYIHM
jgi:hypothetical protein